MMMTKPLLATFLAALLAVPASAQTLERISGQTYLIRPEVEGLTNSVAFAGSEGIVLVDPGGSAPRVQRLLELVEEELALDVRGVVLTGADLDRQLGVLLVPDRTFEVYCHPKARRALAENAADWMAAARERASSDEERASYDAKRFRLPDTPVERQERIKLGDRSALVVHLGEARSNAELVVFSKTDEVIAAGELAFHGEHPELKESSRLAGWKRYLDVMGRPETNRIVPAHGAVLGAPELAEASAYLDALVADAATRDDEALETPGFEDFAEWASPERLERNRDRAYADHRSLHLGRSLDELGLVLARSHPGYHARRPIAFSGDGRAVALGEQLLETGPPVEGGDPLGVTVYGRDSVLYAMSFTGLDILEDVPLRDAEGQTVPGNDLPRIVGPLYGDRYALALRARDEVWIVRSRGFAFEKSYATMPDLRSVSATPDGRLVFAPTFQGGRVHWIDLYNDVQHEDAMVGGGAGSGDCLPDGTELLLPVANKASLAFVNTASREITHLLHDGIGFDPAGVRVSPNGRFAAVWYAAEPKLAIVDVHGRRVLGQVELPGAPFRIAFHPAGRSLWVSYQDRKEIDEFELDARWWEEPLRIAALPQVAVMGMTHSGHLESERWGLQQVAETIRRFRPDAVLVEIPPNRFEKAWTDFTERGVIEEPRVNVFPEYRELMFDLSVELGFELVPCAAWTKEMNDQRRERLRQFDEEPQWTEARADLDARVGAVEASWKDSPVHSDDPRVIHSEEYDRYVRELMEPRGELQNEMVGPGGWYDINRAHMRLVHRAIDERPGQRLLVSFGAYHKYWFLMELSERADVELVDLEPFLPDD